MSSKLEELLAGNLPPGIYRTRARPDRVREMAEGRAWRFFRLDGTAIANKQQFLEACARELCFPPYFGGNWDALEDSLRDLSWVPARRGYVLVYDDAGRFAEGDPVNFGVALSILDDAVNYWRDTSTPMVVLVRGLPAELAELPRA